MIEAREKMIVPKRKLIKLVEVCKKNRFTAGHKEVRPTPMDEPSKVKPTGLCMYNSWPYGQAIWWKTEMTLKSIINLIVYYSRITPQGVGNHFRASVKHDTFRKYLVNPRRYSRQRLYWYQATAPELHIGVNTSRELEADVQGNRTYSADRHNNYSLRSDG